MTLTRRRRRSVVDRPWVWLRQVHGAGVVVVTGATAARVAGVEARRRWSPPSRGWCWPSRPPTALPVVLWSAEGVIGAAHAGWRGLDAGVVEATAAAMRGAGGHRDRGPHRAVHPRGVLRVRRPPTSTAWPPAWATRSGAAPPSGAPALDLPRAFGAGRPPGRRSPTGATRASAPPAHPERWFSFRARAEAGRMATVDLARRRHGRRDPAVTTADRSVAAARAGPDRSGRRWRRASTVLARHQGLRASTRSCGARRRAGRRGGELRPGAARQGDRPRSSATVPRPGPSWHFIGRLQRNKVRLIAPAWRCGRPSTASRWPPRSPDGRPGAAVLVQLNLSGEPQKGGCPPGEAEALVARAVDLGLDVRGLMGVGPGRGARGRPTGLPPPGGAGRPARAARPLDRHERRSRGRRGGGLDHGADRTRSVRPPPAPGPPRAGELIPTFVLAPGVTKVAGYFDARMRPDLGTDRLWRNFDGSVSIGDALPGARSGRRLRRLRPGR